MKISRLFVLAVLWLIAMGAKAQSDGPVPDGTYYLYNIGVGKYLAAGSSWGTKAVLNDAGLDYMVTLTDGGYTLDSQVSNGEGNHYLNPSSNGPWNDGQPFAWTFEEVGDGIFTINNGEQYLSADEDGNILLGDDATQEGAQWRLKTYADRLAELLTATSNNPVDATFLISYANFGRNDLRSTAWTIMDASNFTLSNGDVTNHCAESYHSPFTLSQTLNNIPAGKYAMTAQGFYRSDEGESYVPVFFANGNTMPIPEKTGSENSMSTASASFSDGLYTINPLNVMVSENGQLTVGVRCESSTLWVIFDNFRLTYYGNSIDLSDYQADYQAALNDAQEALADSSYELVSGEERTNLEAVIQAYNQAEDTQEAYEAAIEALREATTVFTSAYSAYKGLDDMKFQAGLYYFPYANPSLRSELDQIFYFTAGNATEARDATNAMRSILLQYVESNARLEAVEDATDITEMILNPDANEGTDYWNLVLGENSYGSITTLSNEPPTYSNGDTYPYFDGGNWGAEAWDVSLQQEVTLPAGKYLLSVSGRASSDVELYLFAGDNTTQMPALGAVGGLYGRGWNDGYVEFELSEESTIAIGVRGVTESQYQWMSFTRFRLASFNQAPDPFVDLTPDMLYSWTGWGADAEKIEEADCAFTIDEPTGLVYGDGNVINYADLSAYNTLVLTVSEGTPRFLFNRDMEDGAWNEDESESHLIDNTKGGWSSKYFTQQGDTLWTVDLKQMVEDKGFAHLHAIKGANWANVTVTSMKLYRNHYVATPAVLATYPENGSFNLPNDISEFRVLFDSPVDCAQLKATLNDISLTVSPADGFAEEVALTREGDDLETGEYTISLTNIIAENAPAGTQPIEYSFKVYIGVIDIDPNNLSTTLVPIEYFNDCIVGSIPEGFKVRFQEGFRFNGNIYGSGPRIFTFAEGGDFTKGLYLREGYAEYGSGEDYPLILEQGKTYLFHFNTAMWKDSGTKTRFEIMNKAGEVEYIQMIDNTPNTNGSTASVTGSTVSDIQFTPAATGNYIVRWTTALDETSEPGFYEILLANVYVKSIVDVPGLEYMLLLDAALENAKSVLEANSEERYFGDVYDNLDAYINQYEGALFTSPSEYQQAADNLDAAAQALQNHRIACDQYDNLMKKALDVVRRNADNKFASHALYGELVRLVRNYNGHSEWANLSEDEENPEWQLSYNYDVLTDDASLNEALAALTEITNTALQLFTEGKSTPEGSNGGVGTGIAVLVERLRLGAETLTSLGVSEDEDIMARYREAMTDDDDLANDMKERITTELYNRLKDPDNTLFEPYLNEETLEEEPPTYDMTVFVKNPNLYKQRESLSFYEENVPGWVTPEGYNTPALSTGWGAVKGNDLIAADCMFHTWGNSYRVEQTITDLPVGIYTVKVGFWERQMDGVDLSDTYLYVNTSTEEARIQAPIGGQAFPFAENDILYIEGVEVTDGILTLGVNAGDGTHTFFNDVRLELIAPVPGYDYASEAGDYLAGDVNLDGEVTTSDAVVTVSIVLDKMKPTKKQFKAADVNQSNTVSVSDVVGIINIILNEIDDAAGARSDKATHNYLLLDGNEVSLMNEAAFVGFQMDVTVADGAVLNGVRLTARAAGLQVACNRVAENTYRVVAFSTDKSAILGDEGQLCSFDIAGDQTVKLSNIEFTDGAARAYALGLSETTGIDGVATDKATAEIFTIDGVKSSQMRKGMNVVKHANGEVKKVFVK